jgi:hypothetical protein
MAELVAFVPGRPLSRGRIRSPEPYPESEIQAEFHDRWLCMRRDITDPAR